MSAFYNIGSLILGLVAWGIPIVMLVRRKGCGQCFASMVCCALSLLLQLLEVKNRVDINDTSAVMDTIGAVAFAGTVLVTVSVALNIWALVRCRKK